MVIMYYAVSIYVAQRLYNGIAVIFHIGALIVGLLE